MTEDKKLEMLRLLNVNSRISVDTLATMLGETEDEVAEAIRRFADDRVILRYSTVVNWDKVESGRITAIIDVKVVPQREVGFDAIAERIYRFPEVKSLFLMSGGYDLQVMVEGYDIKEVSRFVSEKLATIDNVTATTTHFMLKTYKEAGVIFEDREDDRRLVITP